MALEPSGLANRQIESLCSAYPRTATRGDSPRRVSRGWQHRGFSISSDRSAVW